MALRPMKSKCSCGALFTEIPYLVEKTNKTGYVSICKTCDSYSEWPRAK